MEFKALPLTAPRRSALQPSCKQHPNPSHSDPSPTPCATVNNLKAGIVEQV